MTRPDHERDINFLPDGVAFPPGVSLDEKATRRFVEAHRTGVDENLIRGVVFALGETAKKPDGQPAVISTRGDQSFYFDVLNRASRNSTRREIPTDVFPLGPSRTIFGRKKR